MTESLRRGVLAALGAYGIWGLLPLYFKLLADVPADVVLVHRVLWSVLLLALVMLWQRRTDQLLAVIRTPRALLVLVMTSALIAGNWLLYVWAIQTNRVLEASLGYYINPLLNMLLGGLLLGERLTPVQRIAVLLAAIGVIIPLFGLGQFPWVSLVLAGTFAAYGLLRKKVAVDSMTGLFVETLLLLPVAVIYALGWDIFPGGHWSSQAGLTQALLVAAGAVTTVPLVMFGVAATRLRLTTLGFFQYISPSTAFVLAVVFFGEPLTMTRLLTFALIWGALALITWDLWRQQRTARVAALPAE